MLFKGFVFSLFSAALMLVLPGVATAAPQLSLPAEGALHNGQTFLNETSTVTATLTSSGDAPLNLGQLEIYQWTDESGEEPINHAEFFSITDDNCSAETLAPSQQCTFKVNFHPTAIGFRNTTVLIYSDDPNGTMGLGIDGAGVDPGISASPVFEDFGGAPNGENIVKTFTVVNDGTTTLSATGFTFGGTNPENFELATSPSCGAVPPQGSCQFEIRFAATGGTGNKSATLSIGNNTKNNNPKVITLIGRITQAEFAADPSSINFGKVDPYYGSPDDVTLTLKSIGDADLNALAHFGDPPNWETGAIDFESGAFSVNGARCNAGGEGAVGPTPPNEECDLTVSFDVDELGPEPDGVYEETLHIISNGNSEDVPLKATVVSGKAEISSNQLDAGDVEIGHSGSASLTLESTGTAPLKMDPPELDGPDASMFSIDQPSSCESPDEGATCQITVTFTPTSPAGKLAYATLSGNFGTLSVTLQGTGVEAFVNSPVNMTFGETPIGSETTLSDFLISNGDAPFNLDSLTIEGADASSFSVATPASGCSGLVRGQECHFEVSYKPTSVGVHTAELKVKGNIETQTVSLSGSARALTPPRVTLKLTGAKKAKRGKTLTLTLTAKITNRGESAATGITLKTAVARKFAGAVRPIKVGQVASGKSVTRKIKVKVKKKARKGKKLKVTVTASGKGLKAVKAVRLSTIR